MCYTRAGKTETGPPTSCPQRYDLNVKPHPRLSGAVVKETEAGLIGLLLPAALRVDEMAGGEERMSAGAK